MHARDDEPEEHRRSSREYEHIDREVMELLDDQRDRQRQCGADEQRCSPRREIDSCTIFSRAPAFKLEDTWVEYGGTPEDVHEHPACLGECRDKHMARGELSPSPKGIGRTEHESTDREQRQRAVRSESAMHRDAYEQREQERSSTGYEMLTSGPTGSD